MKSSTFRNDILKLIFNATPIANLSDNAATSPLTNLQVALHSADPGIAGDQTTSEIAYTGYARIPVARTSAGWSVTGNIVNPVAAIQFGEMTGGAGGVATHFSIGVANTGASKILRKGVLGSRLGPFSAATTGTFTIPGLTGLAVDDRIVFQSVDGSSLPTGITEGISYWVKTVTGDAITIAATQGGAAIAITAAGDGIAYRSTPISIVTGVAPQLKTTTQIVEE